MGFLVHGLIAIGAPTRLRRRAEHFGLRTDARRGPSRAAGARGVVKRRPRDRDLASREKICALDDEKRETSSLPCIDQRPARRSRRRSILPDWADQQARGEHAILPAAFDEIADWTNTGSLPVFSILSSLTVPVS